MDQLVELVAHGEGPHDMQPAVGEIWEVCLTRQSPRFEGNGGQNGFQKKHQGRENGNLTPLSSPTNRFPNLRVVLLPLHLQQPLPALGVGVIVPRDEPREYREALGPYDRGQGFPQLVYHHETHEELVEPVHHPVHKPEAREALDDHGAPQASIATQKGMPEAPGAQYGVHVDHLVLAELQGTPHGYPVSMAGERLVPGAGEKGRMVAEVQGG